MRIWRTTRECYKDSAFSHIRRYWVEGRWNSEGTPVIYSAETSALAILELLVHTHSDTWPDDQWLLMAEVPDQLVEDLDLGLLPPTWRTSPPPQRLKQLGDDWIRSKRSLGLRVPSAVLSVPLAHVEHNILVNPYHQDIGQVSIIDGARCVLDPRLLIS